MSVAREGIDCLLVHHSAVAPVGGIHSTLLRLSLVTWWILLLFLFHLLLVQVNKNTCSCKTFNLWQTEQIQGIGNIDCPHPCFTFLFMWIILIFICGLVHGAIYKVVLVCWGRTVIDGKTKYWEKLDAKNDGLYPVYLNKEVSNFIQWSSEPKLWKYFDQ